MHVGTFECKNGMKLGKSGKIPKTPEARYQAGELALGIKGSAMQYIPNASAMNADQKSMHASYNLLALGLEPPKALEMGRERRKEINDALPDDKKLENPDEVKLQKEDVIEITKEAQMRQNETKDNSRSVTDVSWSPPKSFSIIHGLTKDETLKKEMEKALIDSVEETIADWEKLAARRIRGWELDEKKEIKKDDYGNKIQSDRDKTTGNIVYSSFLHYDSRPVELNMTDDVRRKLEADGVQIREHDGKTFIIDKKTGEEKPYVRDMQLHLHTPIANLTYDTEEKTWYALQKGEMMRQLPYFQALASQRLASKLENMGFALERTGSRWEIDSLATSQGREVIDMFSKPTANVMQYASDYNLRNREDVKSINQLIRKNKESGVSDADTLQKIWRAQLNGDQIKMLENIEHNRRINAENQGKNGFNFKANLEHHKDSAEDCIRYVISVESARRAAFEKQEIIAKALHFGVTKTPEEMERAFQKLKESYEIRSKTIEQNGHTIEFFTTAELVKEEKDLVDLVIKTNQEHVTPINKMLADTTGEKHDYEASKFGTGDYTESQLSALQSVLASNQRVSFIEGDAGTGKTTVGMQIKRAVEMSGHRLISTSVATKAVDVLTQDGYGKILLVDKNNSIVMEKDELTGKQKPKLASPQEAKEFYIQEYGDEEHIPKGIMNQLKRGATEQPQTLSKLLLGYENYKKKRENPSAFMEAQKDIAAYERKMAGQVLFIDEAGQLGTQQALKVMEMANDLNMRLILVGDRKQHKSVTRGDVLNTLVEKANLEPYAITDIRRQSGQLKMVCNHMANGEYDSAFTLLNEIKGVAELAKKKRGKKGEEAYEGEEASKPRNLKALKEAFADEVVDRMKQGEDPTIVIPDHKTGQEIDTLVREKLSKLDAAQFDCAVNKNKAQNFTLLARNKGLDQSSKRTVVGNYKEGMMLQFSQNIKAINTITDGTIPKGMIGRGTVGEVVAINRAKGRGRSSLTLEFTGKNGETYRRIMPIPKDRESAELFVVNDPQETELCPGDRIMLTKNLMAGKDNRQQLSNGSSYTIKDIREEKGHKVLVLNSGGDNEIILRPETDPAHRNFQRQFYKTSYGSQGGTSDKGACMAFHLAGSGGNLYVDLTRAAGEGKIGTNGKNKDLRLYTDSIDKLIKEARKIEHQPNSALSFAELDKEVVEQKPNEINTAISMLYETEVGREFAHLRYHPNELEAEIKDYGLNRLRALKDKLQYEIDTSQPRKTNDKDTVVAYPSAHLKTLQMAYKLVEKRTIEVARQEHEMGRGTETPEKQTETGVS